MSFQFIRDHAGRWPIRLMCRVLEVSASGYHAWRNRLESVRARANRALLAEVRRIHGEHHGRYGSPRMNAALCAQGRTASRGRVARLMRRHGIRALAGRRFRPCTTDSRHHLPIAANLLKQEFVASAPNRIWLADITFIATGEGWLYLAAVLDLATRRIVGWAMRDHMRTELPLAALMMAMQRQRPQADLARTADPSRAADDHRRQPLRRSDLPRHRIRQWLHGQRLRQLVPQALQRGRSAALLCPRPPQGGRQPARRQGRQRAPDHGRDRPSDVEGSHPLHPRRSAEGAREKRDRADDETRRRRIDREQKCPEIRGNALRLDILRQINQ